MPRVTFVYPCVGRFPDTEYVRSWQMEPLSIAVLAALTPDHWETAFYDDRLEPVDYDEPTELVAISIETFTARRGYEIAAEYRKRGVPVVLGGYHATFRPDEALAHADAVCVGEAEPVWGDILADAEGRCLGGVYRSSTDSGVVAATPAREIFADKPYLDLALVETGRGCRFKCNFCSITAFFGARYRRRPIPDIVAEIKRLERDLIFIVDDNVVADLEQARELFTALKPLGVRWISQASLNVARRPELLDLMAESGCLGLLVGFESLDECNLDRVNKRVNRPDEYGPALDALRRRGILVYGTFLFGLPDDDRDLVDETIRFTRRQKLFLAAFNHVVPFPGTPLYAQLERERRVPSNPWWLSEEYRFGQAPFEPEGMTAEELRQLCHRARKRFYGLPSILRRSLDLRANLGSPLAAKSFFGLNLLLRREVDQKRDLPLGVRDQARGAR